MNALLTALYTKFNNDSTLKNSVTGLYTSAAPQKIDFPFIVMSIISDVPDDAFSARVDKFRVQFSIFSDEPSPEEAGTIFGYLKTCYDYCSLSISGWSHIAMRRLSAFLTRDPEEKWQYVVDYEISAQKS